MLLLVAAARLVGAVPAVPLLRRSAAVKLPAPAPGVLLFTTMLLRVSSGMVVEFSKMPEVPNVAPVEVAAR